MTNSNNENKWYVRAYKKAFLVTTNFISDVVLAVKEIIKKVN